MGEQFKGTADFDETYELYKNIVLQTAAFYTRNKYTAEDIMQEVFLRYYVYIKHAKVNKEKQWLLTTTKNMAYNYVRDHKRETLIDVNEQTEDFFGSDESTESLFFKKLWNIEVLSSTNTILDALFQKNEKWYDAVTLVYCMEKPQKEVAECMGMSVEALQSMLYRAKNWIKKHYKAEFERVDDT